MRTDGGLARRAGQVRHPGDCQDRQDCPEAGGAPAGDGRLGRRRGQARQGAPERQRWRGRRHRLDFRHPPRNPHHHAWQHQRHFALTEPDVLPVPGDVCEVS